MTKIQKPTVGRIIEVALANTERGLTIHRPAIVVHASMGGEDGVNCQVFLDGSNDRGVNGSGSATLWKTSLHYDADGKPDTWRYPPRSEATIDV